MEVVSDHESVDEYRAPGLLLNISLPYNQQIIAPCLRTLGCDTTDASGGFGTNFSVPESVARNTELLVSVNSQYSEAVYCLKELTPSGV